MTFKQLQIANKSLDTTSIKGKEYVMVNQRIKAFRLLYPNGMIETEIVSNVGGVVTMKATVRDDFGAVLGTGHAYEKEESSYINKTSYIENCETSAVGRALGMVGIGIDTAVASAEEMENAVRQQAANEPIDTVKVETLKTMLAERGKSVEGACDFYGVESLEDMNMGQFMNLLHRLEKHER